MTACVIKFPKQIIEYFSLRCRIHEDQQALSAAGQAGGACQAEGAGADDRALADDRAVEHDPRRLQEVAVVADLITSALAELLCCPSELAA